MKKNVILKQLISEMHEFFETNGFSYNGKIQGFIRYDQSSKLYFIIDFLVMDYNKRIEDSKYIELFVNISHHDISSKLKELFNLKANPPIQYFKLFGNLFSDIYLNKESDKYISRNNHNYFKLIIESETDIKIVVNKITHISSEEIFPFFIKFNNLENIYNKLNQIIEEEVSVTNSNKFRLLSLLSLSKIIFGKTDPDLKIYVFKYFSDREDNISLDVAKLLC